MLHIETIVIYKSKTGYTKKYAEFIAEDLDAEIYDLQEVSIKDLDDYGTIIYGGGLYSGVINGIDFITKNLENLQNHKVIVFATGICSGINDEIIEIKNTNFTNEQQEIISFFYLRGGFNFKSLSLMDKYLIYLIKLKLKIKKNLTSNERDMLSIYDIPVDFTKRENIYKLVDKVKYNIDC